MGVRRAITAIAKYALITETLVRAAYIGYDYCSTKINVPYAAANPKQVNETIEALMQEINAKIARLKADKNSQNAK